MSTEPTIDKVEVIDLRNWTGPGDDGLFVALHAGDRIGWYGPVADQAGEWIRAVLADVALGAPATDHQALCSMLRHAVDPMTTSASWAIGAIDCAAWDLHGQLAGAPAANLITTSPATEVSLYASWLRLDLTAAHAGDTVGRVGRAGWAFTKWGLRRPVDQDPHLAAQELSQAARVAATALNGPAAFDAVFTWDTVLTGAFAANVDATCLLWLEDPLPEHRLESYRHLDSSLPLAIGERLLIGSDTEAYLSLRPRALTLDVVGCGGLTHAIELVAAANQAGISVYPHGRSFVAGLHLAAAFPEVIPAVEYRLQWEPVQQLIYQQPWLPIRGHIRMPTTPGLGATPRSR